MVNFVNSVGKKSSSNSTPFFIQKFIIGLDLDPNVICAIIARPLFKPTFCPSGVSDGHTQPYWVACNLRLDIAGLAISPILSIILLRWAIVKLRVNLSNCWTTPFFCPMFPILSCPLKCLLNFSIL